MYYSLEKRIWFTIIFLPTFTYLVPFGVIKNRVTKISFKYFHGNCDYYSFPGGSILFLYAPAQEGLAF